MPPAKHHLSLSRKRCNEGPELTPEQTQHGAGAQPLLKSICTFQNPESSCRNSSSTIKQTMFCSPQNREVFLAVTGAGWSRAWDIPWILSCWSSAGPCQVWLPSGDTHLEASCNAQVILQRCISQHSCHGSSWSTHSCTGSSSAVSQVDLFSAMSCFGCSTVSSDRINFQGISKPCVKQWHKREKGSFLFHKRWILYQNCLIYVHFRHEDYW